MSSGDLLRKAEELFGCGRYQECEELLQLGECQDTEPFLRSVWSAIAATSQLVGFTRQQWSVRCNTLACQMKVSVGCSKHHRKSGTKLARSLLAHTPSSEGGPDGR